ncbi:MAG: tail fiber domain-containing protein, partial [Armatimonadetes bacterium]|nr:tail fiber domain-containing protein [Armatimonadota bacterium]
SGAHYGFGIQDRLLQIYTDNAIGNIAFGYGSSANFTEVMRIEGTGNIGIGTSYPEERLHVAGNLRLDGEIRTLGQIVLLPDWDNVGDDFGVRIGPSQAKVPPYTPVGLSINMRDMTGIPLYLATGGTPSAWLGTITAINHGDGRAGFFQSNGQTCVIITSGGGSYVGDWPSGWRGGLATWDICASGVYASEFRTRSDERLKRDIQSLDASSELQRLLSLRPVSYYWRDERLPQTMQYGFIAQELREVFPELVSEGEDDQRTLAVNYQALIPLLVNALQAQQEQIRQQETRIQKLEAELQRLQGTSPK